MDFTFEAKETGRGSVGGGRGVGGISHQHLGQLLTQGSPLRCAGGNPRNPESGSGASLSEGVLAVLIRMTLEKLVVTPAGDDASVTPSLSP